METLIKDQFKYIVKEKTKSVIIISDSDDEDVPVTTVIPTLPVPIRSSNKRKRKRTLPGNANDPIALLSDSDDEAGGRNNAENTATSTTGVINDIHTAKSTSAEGNTKAEAIDKALSDTNPVANNDAPTATPNNVVNDTNDAKYIHNTNTKNDFDDTTTKNELSDININCLDGSDNMNTFVQEIKSTFDDVFGSPQLQEHIKNEIVEMKNPVGATHIVVHTTESSTLITTETTSELSQAMDEDFSSDDGLDFDLLISTSEITLSPPMSPFSDAAVSDIPINHPNVNV